MFGGFKPFSLRLIAAATHSAPPPGNTNVIVGESLS